MCSLLLITAAWPINPHSVYHTCRKFMQFCRRARMMRTVSGTVSYIVSRFIDAAHYLIVHHECTDQQLQPTARETKAELEQDTLILAIPIASFIDRLNPIFLSILRRIIKESGRCSIVRNFIMSRRSIAFAVPIAMHYDIHKWINAWSWRKEVIAIIANCKPQRTNTSRRYLSVHAHEVIFTREFTSSPNSVWLYGL